MFRSLLLYKVIICAAASLPSASCSCSPPRHLQSGVVGTACPLRVMASQPYVYVHALDPPLPPAEQAPQPLHAQACPLGPPRGDLVRGGAGEGLGRRVGHVDDGGVERRATVERCGVDAGAAAVPAGAGPREEPVAAEVEEAAVGPVARGEEEDEQQDGAVDAGPVEEVGADEEEEDEGGRGVGGDEEQRQPAGNTGQRRARPSLPGTLPGRRSRAYLLRQNMAGGPLCARISMLARVGWVGLRLQQRHGGSHATGRVLARARRGAGRGRLCSSRAGAGERTRPGSRSSRGDAVAEYE